MMDVALSIQSRLDIRQVPPCYQLSGRHVFSRLSPFPDAPPRFCLPSAVDVDSQLLCWEEVSLTGLRDRGPLDITLVDHNALRQDLIDELEGVRKQLEYLSLRPPGGEATSETV
jgi:hypothetical protein